MNAMHCAESLNAAITLGIEGTNLKASKLPWTLEVCITLMQFNENQGLAWPSTPLSSKRWAEHQLYSGDKICTGTQSFAFLATAKL